MYFYDNKTWSDLETATGESGFNTQRDQELPNFKRKFEHTNAPITVGLTGRHRRLSIQCYDKNTPRKKYIMLDNDLIYYLNYLICYFCLFIKYISNHHYHLRDFTRLCHCCKYKMCLYKNMTKMLAIYQPFPNQHQHLKTRAHEKINQRN